MKPKGPIQLRSHDPQYDFIWYKLYPFFIFRNEIIFQIQTSSCLGKDITWSTCSRRRKWYRRSSTWKSRRSTEWFTRWFEGLTGLWAAQGKNSIVDRSALVHFICGLNWIAWIQFVRTVDLWFDPKFWIF